MEVALHRQQSVAERYFGLRNKILQSDCGTSFVSLILHLNILMASNMQNKSGLQRPATIFSIIFNLIHQCFSM